MYYMEVIEILVMLFMQLIFLYFFILLFQFYAYITEKTKINRYKPRKPIEVKCMISKQLYNYILYDSIIQKNKQFFINNELSRQQLKEIFVTAVVYLTMIFYILIQNRLF